MTPTLFSYLPEEAAVQLCKMAEEAPKKRPNPLGPIAAGALGMGVGTLAGFGGAHAVNAIYKHTSGKSIPIPYLTAAAPIIGGGLGLAYNLAQAHQIEAMRHAAESPDDKPRRSDT
jgi:hypothetical protein